MDIYRALTSITHSSGPQDYDRGRRHLERSIS